MKGNSPGEGRGGAVPAPTPWGSSFALKHMNQMVLLEETGIFDSSLTFQTCKALSIPETKRSLAGEDGSEMSQLLNR